MGKCYICGSTKGNPHSWHNSWNNTETDTIYYCPECDKFVSKAWYSLFENQNNGGGWLKSESEFWRLFDAAKDMYLKKTNAASIPPPEKDPVYVSTTLITDHVRIHKIKNDDGIIPVKEEIFKIGDLINLKNGYLDSMSEGFYKNRLNEVKWPTKIVGMGNDCVQITAETDAYAAIFVSKFYVEKIESIKEKVDQYKEHEKKLQRDPNYQQFLLNQHKCDICGKIGNDYEPIFLIKKDSYQHCLCSRLVSYYAKIANISEEESVKIIKEKLFSSSKQEKTEKKEQQVLCSADFFENPWRR